MSAETVYRCDACGIKIQDKEVWWRVYAFPRVGTSEGPRGAGRPEELCQNCFEVVDRALKQLAIRASSRKESARDAVSVEPKTTSSGCKTGGYQAICILPPAHDSLPPGHPMRQHCSGSGLRWGET